MIVVENPEVIEVKDKASETRFRKAIESQISIWLTKNRENYGIPRVFHTFFYNKACFYSALALGKTVSSGWYLYGPYLRSYGEEYQDEDRFIDLFAKSSFEVKFQDDLVSDKVQKVLTSLFENYRFDKRDPHGSLYAFLKYIYESRSETFKEGQKFYLAKLNCNRAIHSKVENFSEIEKSLAIYQKELCRTSFANKIKITEAEQQLVLEYADLIVDAFERSVTPDIISDVGRDFSAMVNKIPALRANIITGSSYDEKTERQWKNHFMNQLREDVVPIVKNSLQFNSRRIYG
ncbi:hypothetical protein HY993_04310 [Candidatus Micrarchaeota archaeon]|nr:hypothetical protein [Candidatus Micrarchaeota archaeon]